VASFAYCQATIVFGGKQEGNLRFCNERCLIRGRLLVRSQSLPQGNVDAFVQKLHMGACPQCQGPGPVDVFTAHQVWSALFLTSWKSSAQSSCKSCGTKSQVKALLLSLVLGWWGFPWGLVMTPVQIVRNVRGMMRTPDPLRASPELERLARVQLASQQAA